MKDLLNWIALSIKLSGGKIFDEGLHIYWACKLSLIVLSCLSDTADKKRKKQFFPN